MQRFCLDGVQASAGTSSHPELCGAAVQLAFSCSLFLHEALLQVIGVTLGGIIVRRGGRVRRKSSQKWLQPVCLGLFACFFRDILFSLM